jgi:hypothetical protein
MGKKVYIILFYTMFHFLPILIVIIFNKTGVKG